MAENTELVSQQEPVTPTTQEPVTPTTNPGEPVFTEREKQYYARMKKLEAENAELKKPQTPAVPSASPTEVTPAEVPFDTLASFVEATRDLKTTELSELRSEAKALGVDPMKYISSKSGQAHLAEIRRTAASTESTPGPSNRVRTFNGKPVDSILTDSNATKSDKQAAWEAKLTKNRGTNSAQ